MATDHVLADGPPAGDEAPYAHDQIARALGQWQAERPDLDVSSEAVIARVRRLSSLLSDEIAAEHAHHGLDDAEYDALAALRRSGEPFELATSDLARLAGTTTVEIDRRVDRLAETGMVVRTDTGRIALTPSGRSVIDEAFTAHVANSHRLIGPLSAAERADVERLLIRWLDALEGPDHVSR